jgi:diaminopimelate epimerase
MTLQFAKFHGAGNDFVLVDGRDDGPGDGTGATTPVDWAALARDVCDRHHGVGADGLLVAARPELPAAAHHMRMFNPDGSESEMCGNGLRCFAAWLRGRGELGPGTVPVETGAGLLTVEAEQDGHDRWYAAGMGRPRLAPAEIPLSAAAAAGQPPAGPVLHLAIELPHEAGSVGLGSSLASGSIEATCVSMGNPHAVLFVPDAGAVPLEALGPFLERHPFFPQRTNVEVCAVIGRERLRVRVWERGAGITLACGTGACAAMVAAHLRGLVDERVTVELPGGALRVEWPGPDRVPDAEVVLRGPVEHVYDGAWRKPLPLPALANRA